MTPCHEKIRYTKREAENAARRVSYEKNKYMRAYKCKRCGKWHTTSQKRRD